LLEAVVDGQVGRGVGHLGEVGGDSEVDLEMSTAGEVEQMEPRDARALAGQRQPVSGQVVGERPDEGLVPDSTAQIGHRVDAEVGHDSSGTVDDFGLEQGTGVRTCRFEIAHDSLRDRKSTRLNSSHVSISYAVFCLKKKKKTIQYTTA